MKKISALVLLVLLSAALGVILAGSLVLIGKVAWTYAGQL